MEIKVVQANLKDLTLLMEWRMRVLQEVFAIPREADTALLARANRQYYEQQLAAGGHIACFALNKANEEIVGCGGICLYQEMPSPDNPSGACGYLMNIYTLPGFRGRGVGRKIVDWLIQQAKQRGTGKIYLETSACGRTLYQEMGFNPMQDYLRLAAER